MEVEDFLSQLEKLIEEGKDEEAEKLVKDFAKGKEDEVAELLGKVGVDIGNKGEHEKAIYYFIFTRRISGNMDIIRKATESYATACFNTGIHYLGLSEGKNKEINLKKSLIAFKKVSKIKTEDRQKKETQKKLPWALTSYQLISSSPFLSSFLGCVLHTSCTFWYHLCSRIECRYIKVLFVRNMNQTLKSCASECEYAHGTF